MVINYIMVKRSVQGFETTVCFDQGIKKTVIHVLGTQELLYEDEDFDMFCD